MPQLEQIEAIEKRLWGAADTLRAKLGQAFTDDTSPILQQIDVLSTEIRKLMKARDLLLPRLMNREMIGS